MQTIDSDYVEELFMTHTHHYIMFFTQTDTSTGEGIPDT